MYAFLLIPMIWFYNVWNYKRLSVGVVATLDESVGRVIDALRRTDMLKNSIIIFIADNGAQTEGIMQNSGSNYPLRGVNAVSYKHITRL